MSQSCESSDARSSKMIDYEAAERTGRQLQRARNLFAYGGLDGVMNRPLMHDQGLYPHFAVQANGYQVTDSNGKTYVDWINGWGSVILGHSHPVVRDAIIKQADNATSIALMHPVEIDCAELIVDMVPNAEMVAFGKNGSDALNASIRIARAKTGRKLILHNGFHGFHDWYTCQFPNVQGILPELRDHIKPFPYNDLPALESMLEENQDRVAAILMEPVNMYIPDSGYLASVKQLAEKHGAILIWDEVVTAFRLGIGGAQEYFGVEPHLAVLGKAMGNGMPLSAVVGPAELMKHLPRTAYGMTYRGETISLAAARACLEFMRENNVPGHLEQVGTKLRNELASIARENGVKCELSGPSARLTFVFYNQGDRTWEELRSIFVLECLKRGVLTNGNALASFSHCDRALEMTLEVFDQAMNAVGKAIDSSSAQGTGTDFAHDASAINIKGCVDAIEKSPEGIQISGWCIVNGGIADSLKVVWEDGKEFKSEINLRPDIADSFQDVTKGEKAGFKIKIPRNPDGNIEKRFRIVATIGGIERFHCLVVNETADHEVAARGPKWFRDGILFI